MLNTQEIWCLFVTDTHRKSLYGSQCMVVLGTIYQLSLLHIPIIVVENRIVLVAPLKCNVHLLVDTNP